MYQRSEVAWDGHADRLCEIISSFDAPDVLEFGGGRFPFFESSVLPSNVRSYTVNDISPDELERAPHGYRTACFDVCGDVSAFSGQYDVIFSKMFAEHVSDGEKMHRNALDLLRPGGVAFHFMPKLYALPFFANWILPERISRFIVYNLNSRRRDEIPKFPTVYSWCRGTAGAMERRIQKLGYSDVTVTPFFGNTYVGHLPVVSSMEKWTNGICMRNGWTLFAAFAYVVARK